MSFIDWQTRSEEMAQLYPDSYVQHFPNMLLDDEVALVTPEDHARILRLPTYDASVPTGVYLGKMWLNHGDLFTYEPDPKDPDTQAMARRREILVVTITKE